MLRRLRRVKNLKSIYLNLKAQSLYRGVASSNYYILFKRILPPLVKLMAQQRTLRTALTHPHTQRINFFCSTNGIGSVSARSTPRSFRFFYYECVYEHSLRTHPALKVLILFLFKFYYKELTQGLRLVLAPRTETNAVKVSRGTNSPPHLFLWLID